VVQVGVGRAFYADDLLDNFARSSLREIDPDLQKVKIGRWVSMSPTPSESNAFKVDSFAPREWLSASRAAVAAQDRMSVGRVL
jgi:hypothetical protein